MAMTTPTTTMTTDAADGGCPATGGARAELVGGWRANTMARGKRYPGRCVVGMMLVQLACCIVSARPARACVGDACLQIWSTAPGGGELALRYDFTRKVQTYESFCTPDRSQCLYSTIDPGFIAESEDLHPGFYPLRDGTAVRLELVSADPGLVLSVNGRKLERPGDAALLGVMPQIHVHPAWQLFVAGDTYGDHRISYRLTADSASYEESEDYTSIVTNVPPPTPSPTFPVATATPVPCAGDCDGDGSVTVAELVRGVATAMGGVDLGQCPSFDADADGAISIDELIRAVGHALAGCPGRVPASFEAVRDRVFVPRCALPGCHAAGSAAANLVLEAGRAYGEVVGVQPDTESARLAGFLLVKPGDPRRSFLFLKLSDPPPGMGSRMPLGAEPLSPAEVELVRSWILGGAPP